MLLLFRLHNWSMLGTMVYHKLFEYHSSALISNQHIIHYLQIYLLIYNLKFFISFFLEIIHLNFSKPFFVCESQHD